MTSLRAAIGTTTTQFAVIIVAITVTMGFATFSQPSAFNQQPCGSFSSLGADESVVMVNGVSKCIFGPPLYISDDGKADFRNGTVVDLHVNATGASSLGDGGGGTSLNDTLILTNDTRIVFNSRGIIATVSPYEGKEVFSNGTVVTFPACPYHIANPDLSYPRGLYGNGTSFYTLPDGMLVKFEPNGTCHQEPSSHATTTQTTSSSSSTCSGYPPGGDCLANYSYVFTISVNYSGSWKLTYQGYSCLGCKSNPLNVSGSRTGSGFFSTTVTLSGPNTTGLTLCASAQKSDASDSTLILTVTGHNETSLPYGSTSYCGGVVP